MTTRLIALIVALAAGCGESEPLTAGTPPPDVATDTATVEDAPAAPEDPGAVDVPSVPLDVSLTCSIGTPEGKAAACADKSQLGKALTTGFGRADGVVSAVIGPLETHCVASCNPTHLTVQVDIGGKPHRLVVTMVDKYSADHEMFFASKAAPLAGPPWSEGWHVGEGVALDYVATLGLHAADFASFHRDELAAKVSDALAIGAKVSIYATAEDDPARAHLVHRYTKKGKARDGAIVADPDGQPMYMMFFYEGEKGF